LRDFVAADITINGAAFSPEGHQSGIRASFRPASKIKRFSIQNSFIPLAAVLRDPFCSRKTERCALAVKQANTKLNLLLYDDIEYENCDARVVWTK
jgi:hypothetical protein